MSLERKTYTDRLRVAIQRSPATALLGPRQCGKTTLAREIALETKSHFFDLESPKDQLRLQNPERALEKLTGLVVLDEVQSRPDLFPVLRTLIDRSSVSASYLLLGSASPTLLRNAGETLAGRIEFVDLHGFDIAETGSANIQENWVRGGFPRSFLADSDDDSAHWREGFIRTFLQRDLPQFGIQVPEPTMRRFWTMLSHTHGQVLNSSGLARSMGMTDKTIRQYVDHLEQTYMVRVLPPWFENLKKRQVKAPKIYIRDSGILHTLQSISSSDQLDTHPLIGASWEGFAIEQIIRIHALTQVYFWATHASAELDLFVLHQGKRFGFEMKLTESPRVHRSMRTACQDLNLDHLYVIYPGQERAELDTNITAVGLQDIAGLFGPDIR
jgi:predicted AAA+ superfamily ATPase